LLILATMQLNFIFKPGQVVWFWNRIIMNYLEKPTL